MRIDQPKTDHLNPATAPLMYVEQGPAGKYEKMAVKCCKCSNNQSLRHFLSNSPWSSADLLKYVRNKATRIISKNDALILDDSGIKKSGNCSGGIIIKKLKWSFKINTLVLKQA